MTNSKAGARMGRADRQRVQIEGKPKRRKSKRIKRRRLGTASHQLHPASQGVRSKERYTETEKDRSSEAKDSCDNLR